MSPFRWFVLGFFAAALALVSYVALVLYQFDSYHWPAESEVSVDAQEHVVEVHSGSTTLIWAYQATKLPRCTVRDTDSSAPLPLTEAADYVRPGGSAGDYVGRWEFKPTSDRVSVTCTGAMPNEVFVEKKPLLPPALADLGPLISVPIIFGTLAIAAWAMPLISRRPAQRARQPQDR